MAQKHATIKVTPRTETGRNKVNQLRQQGFVPAVLYGTGTETKSLTVNAVQIADVLNSSTSENILINLEFENEKENKMALIKSVQHDPLKDTLIHVDFREVTESTRLHTEVPVVRIGEPVGVKTNGGVLDQMLRSFTIECLPSDLPEKVEVNVENLDIDQSILIQDIALPKGVRVLHDSKLTVFIVHPPRVQATTSAEPTAEQAKEPEVLTKKPEKTQDTEKK